MNRLDTHCLRTYGSTARCGAALGYLLAMAYALAFVLYGIVRIALHIPQALTWQDGLLGTIVASAFSFAVGAIAFALLISILPAIIEMVALLIARWLSAALNPQQSPARAVAIGLAVAGGLALLINLLAYHGMGVYFAQLGLAGYVFWFGVRA